MSFLRSVADGFRSLLWSKRHSRELSEEVNHFLEMAAEKKIQQGMGRKDALRAVRLEHGGSDIAEEEIRSASWESFLENSWHDLRFAARMLRKSSGFTAVAVLTLALGIGANTAIFSVVYAVLLKPLPYAKSDPVFNVFQAKPNDSIPGTGWSYPNFAELRGHNHTFTALAGAQRHELTLTGRGEPLVVETAVVTAEFFSLFDAQPLAGRTFYLEDGKSGAPPVVILGENLWRGTLGGDPSVIGSTINLDKRPFTVIGVMPARFRFPLSAAVTQPPQAWVPLAQDPLFGPWMERRAGHWLQVTGRAKPGISM